MSQDAAQDLYGVISQDQDEGEGYIPMSQMSQGLRDDSTSDEDSPQNSPNAKLKASAPSSSSSSSSSSSTTSFTTSIRPPTEKELIQRDLIEILSPNKNSETTSNNSNTPSRLDIFAMLASQESPQESPQQPIQPIHNTRHSSKKRQRPVLLEKSRSTQAADLLGDLTKLVDPSSIFRNSGEGSPMPPVPLSSEQIQKNLLHKQMEYALANLRPVHRKKGSKKSGVTRTFNRLGVSKAERVTDIHVRDYNLLHRRNVNRSNKKSLVSTKHRYIQPLTFTLQTDTAGQQEFIQTKRSFQNQYPANLSANLSPPDKQSSSSSLSSSEQKRNAYANYRSRLHPAIGGGNGSTPTSILPELFQGEETFCHRCKNDHCLRKYCACRAVGNYCDKLCTCQNCKNVPGFDLDPDWIAGK